jgi:hypothetical protein
MIAREPLLAIVVVVSFGYFGDYATGEPQATEGQPSRMSWLDNGRIRLGVDLSIGGAITFLADARTKVNMINSHDWGRQIQMSFYSGPNPFVPDGATVSPHWKKLGWNPIQSGDCFGYRSRVTEHGNNGETLHVRCVPMHWPLKNVPGQCEFECWFRLKGPTVLATSRLTNHRLDQTQYPARSQELPAVYTNGPWYKLVSYLGSEPFTGAAPTVLVDRDDGKGWPWRTFYSPEHWAALVDKDDCGVGLYMPGACAFTGGFAGRKGQGGPKDGPTGHMTPRHMEILDHNIVYTYQYTLIVGSLNEIREYVYQSHGKGTLPQWCFAEDRQHWRYRHTTDTGWPIRDCLVVNMGPKDTALVSPKTFWRAEAAPRLYVRAAFETDGTSAAVAFQPFDDVDSGDWPAWGETKRPKPGPVGHVPFAVQGDGKVRTFEIDLSRHEDYRGAMTQLQLRLPPVEGTAKIYSIAFLPPTE